MNDTITLPLWMFVVLAVLAAWAALVFLFVPSVRWFLRRRVNAVMRSVGERLQVELPSFKLTRREILIDRLLNDPKVLAAVDAQAAGQGESRPDVVRRVERYAREIVPSFNAYLYFRIGYALARATARLLYRVRIGYFDEEAIRRVDRKSTIVFVMNHRSNMDYVLVAFLAAERAALSYAVGEWARVWPLQQLIRSMGAFFVRRNSGDPLYRAVLARYVQMASEGGVTQAVFPEGGLTIDGKLRPPRFGLVDYMLKTFDEKGARDLVFIPIGLNYDRVLEDRSQLLKLDPDRRRTGRWKALRTTLGFAGANLWLMLTGRWHRFGYACVNFGTPMSMRDYVRERGIHFPALDDAARRTETTEIARRLMVAIGSVVPVLPVSLVASLLVREPARTWSELELKAAAHARMRELETAGAHLYLPRQDHDYAFGVGLRMLTLRRIVVEDDGLFRPSPDELDVLAYYANAIAHLAG
ncbi:MAG: 1-acyl-sn-glycerol-3-phosphate acyltransferase [Burkholderiales bacterium]